MTYTWGVEMTWSTVRDAIILLNAIGLTWYMFINGGVVAELGEGVYFFLGGLYLSPVGFRIDGAIKQRRNHQQEQS